MLGFALFTCGFLPIRVLYVRNKCSIVSELTKITVEIGYNFRPVLGVLKRGFGPEEDYWGPGAS